jgi:hypothetical protein
METRFVAVGSTLRRAHMPFSQARSDIAPTAKSRRLPINVQSCRRPAATPRCRPGRVAEKNYEGRRGPSEPARGSRPDASGRLELPLRFALCRPPRGARERQCRATGFVGAVAPSITRMGAGARCCEGPSSFGRAQIPVPFRKDFGSLRCRGDRRGATWTGSPPRWQDNAAREIVDLRVSPRHLTLESPPSGL